MKTIMFILRPLFMLMALLFAGMIGKPGFVRCSCVQENRHDKTILGTLLPDDGQFGLSLGAAYNNTCPEGKNVVHSHSVQKEREAVGLADGDQLSILFWNVENFFDWRNDSTTVSDAEFSSRGERHWTWKRFQAKANAFAKALLWIEGETGHLPDIVGLEEVENAFVLRQVLQKTLLRKLDYRYVHYDSPDRRGIDVALLYRTSVLELIDSKPCHLYAGADSMTNTPDTIMATRDILLCTFRLKQADKPGDSVSPVIPGGPVSPVISGLTGNLSDQLSFAVLVNHHPSKYGGAAESEPRRRIAVERLRFLADSLKAVGIDRIVAGGDFNDTPDNPVFQLLEPVLIPTHMDLHRRGLGTIKYDGKWDLIDHIYVSPGWFTPPVTAVPSNRSAPLQVLDSSPGPGPLPALSMRILRIPFLLTRDTAHSGEKPLRTYTGPRYSGGVSDHLPVLLEVSLPP